MTGNSTFRSIGFAPLSCAILGGVLTLGTVVGQHGPEQADAASASPMAGMDHSAMGGMDHSSMAGMDHASTTATDDSGAQTGQAPAATATEQHADMDMTQPGMAASMPHGFHASCATKATCTVVFARDSSGVAHLLGVKTKLQKLTATTARVLAGTKPLTLRAGKVVKYRGLTWKVVRIDATEVAIKVRRSQ